MALRSLAAATALLIVTTAATSGPELAGEPTITRRGGAHVISFAASEPTDVAVYIENAKGRVVRHLAAGVLGRNAPEPLKPGLKQELVWDGLDDLDRPARGGPFKARVGLGLKPEFAGLIGHHDTAGGRSVRGLAVDGAGNVYVFCSYGGIHNADGAASCHVLDREGKYLRTILPPPADLKEEEWGGLRRVRLRDGRVVPFICQVEVGSIVPGADELGLQKPVITSGGRIGWAGNFELGRANGLGRGIASRIMCMSTTGAMNKGELYGPVLADPGHGGFMALSPDEKTIYATGMKVGAWVNKKTHAVYSCAWADGRVVPFIGSPSTPGKGATGLNNPRDVAVDGKGNLYVADFGNSRVAVFDGGRRLLGEIEVREPLRVAVHRKSGAVYVVEGAKGARLHKFASFRDTRPVATQNLPVHNAKPSAAVMVVDDRAPEPIVWIGHTCGHKKGVYTLLRLVDKGDAFAKTGDMFPVPKQPLSACEVKDMGLDRIHDVLWLTNDGRWERYYYAVEHPATNSTLKPFHEIARQVLGPISVGLDGNLYCADYPGASVVRFGPDGALKPFAKGDARQKGRIRGPASNTWRTRPRGIAADAKGNVYVLMQTGPRSKAIGAGEPNDLAVFDAQGNMVDGARVHTDFRLVSSPRVDYRGNIYLMVGVRPGSAPFPEELKGQIPLGRKDPMAVRQINGYPLVYGSIVKFGPEGGQMRHDIQGSPANYGYGNRTFIQGAAFVYSGCSPAPSFRTKGTPDICLCATTSFDVDGFGRSFFPDIGRFRVGVIDANANEVTTIGSYGNPDSAGPDSRVPEPAIAFRFPYAVAVGPRYCYVADELNRRVVRVKLSCRAEVTMGF